MTATYGDLPIMVAGNGVSEPNSVSKTSDCFIGKQRVVQLVFIHYYLTYTILLFLLVLVVCHF